MLTLVAVPLVQATEINVTVKRFDEVAYFPKSSVPASVISLRDSTLAARINSWVQSIPVEAGERVSKGDVLVTLDCSTANAMLAQQQAAVKVNAARLNLAQYQLKRAQSLRDKKHVSEEVLYQRQADVDMFSAEARSHQASVVARQVDVDHCQVKAPFLGVVQKRMVDEGESVSTGQALLQLVDNERLEVIANVPALAIRQAKLQGVKQFHLQIADKLYGLELRSIIPVTDPQSRHQEVRFRIKQQVLPNPGDSGRLLWEARQRALPSDYLVKRGNQYGVFVAREGKAVLVQVEHAQEGRPVYIVLEDQTQVIVDGRQIVNHGDALKIVR